MNQVYFMSDGINFTITIIVLNMEVQMQKVTIDGLHSLLKVIRENSYNDSGKFKRIYVIGSRLRNNLPPVSSEIWQTNSCIDLIIKITFPRFLYRGC